MLLCNPGFVQSNGNCKFSRELMPNLLLLCKAIKIRVAKTASFHANSCRILRLGIEKFIFLIRFNCILLDRTVS